MANKDGPVATHGTQFANTLGKSWRKRDCFTNTFSTEGGELFPEVAVQVSLPGNVTALNCSAMVTFEASTQSSRIYYQTPPVSYLPL